MVRYDLEASLAEQRTGQHAEGCVKTAADLGRYRRILDEVRPALVVECGTFSGKFALWLVEHGAGRVATIDIDDRNIDEATRNAWGDRVAFHHGPSTYWPAVSFAEDAAAQADGPVMVVLDSWHGASHVRDEMDRYDHLVTVGSYMVVEDTIVRWCPWEQTPEGPYEGSPADAVHSYLASDANRAWWVQDAEVDAMFATGQHQGGWLRRLR